VGIEQLLPYSGRLALTVPQQLKSNQKKFLEDEKVKKNEKTVFLFSMDSGL